MIDQGVFLIGARKCGSTYLFNLMSQHTALAPCQVKEPAFFCLSEQNIQDHLGFYKSLFENGIILDGSTYYSTFPYSIENILKYVRNPRFIYVIRNPVNRFFSGYSYLNRNHERNDQRSFQEVLQDYSSFVPSNDIHDEDKMVQQLASKSIINASHYNKNSHREMGKGPMDTDYDDMLWEYKYLRMSLYSHQIATLKSFGMDRYHLVVFEELIQSPEHVLNGVIEFLGLPMEVLSVNAISQNNTHVVHNPILRMLLTQTQKLNLGLGLKRTFIRNFGDRPEMTVSEKLTLKAMLSDEIDYWTDQRSDLKELWQ